MEPFQAIKRHLEPFGAGLSNFENFGTFWTNLERFEAIWSNLELFGVCQKELVLFGDLWSHLELFGAMWSHLEPFEANWNHLEVRVRGVGALLIGPPIRHFIGGLRYIGHMVVCYCLVSPLDIRTTRTTTRTQQGQGNQCQTPGFKFEE